MDIEFLAEELHKTYRAAVKAFTGRYHDHGFGHCNKKDYFRQRAQGILETERRNEVFRASLVCGDSVRRCEEVEEYDALIDRWTGPCEGFSRMIFYYAQEWTLKALGLAAIRAERSRGAS